MNTDLVIVFVKNILLGKVKTRLAESIGDYGAFEVYKELVDITEQETSRLQNADVQIYFSDVAIETKWEGRDKFVQQGDDLGARMKNAFANGFEQGYKRIIGIGSDLPDMNVGILEEAIQSLTDADTVFGPSADGGYYLLGMTKVHDCIFDNKVWSTNTVMQEALSELDQNGLSYSLLTELNDIDTLEDLQESSLANKFEHLYELSRSNK